MTPQWPPGSPDRPPTFPVDGALYPLRTGCSRSFGRDALLGPLTGTLNIDWSVASAQVGHSN